MDPKTSHDDFPTVSSSIDPVDLEIAAAVEELAQWRAYNDGLQAIIEEIDGEKN